MSVLKIVTQSGTEMSQRGTELICIFKQLTLDMIKYLFLTFSLLIFGISILEAETLKVNSVVSLQQAINTVKPGDRIVVEKGIYSTSESIVIKCSGTSVNKITIETESFKITDPQLVQNKSGVFHSSFNLSGNPSGRYETIQATNRPLTISDVGPGADN